MTEMLNILKLCSDQISKENVNDFLIFLKEEGIGIDSLCKKFYTINRGWMDLDMREKRSIGGIRQMKKVCALEYLKNKQKLDMLKDYIGFGIDLQTYIERQITDNECVVTLFDTGKWCKTQELNGYHIIIEKGKTLMFDPVTYSIKIIDTISAEDLDDKNPNKYTFIDSIGSKHTSKYIYSKRLHTELYDFIEHSL